MKYFVVDYKFDGNQHDNGSPVKTRIFDFHDEQDEAQAFCKQVKAKGGVTNIRIRDIEPSVFQ